MSKKITTEIFKKMVENNLKGDGKDFIVLEDYTGTHNKIKMEYIPKKLIFYMTPNHFLNGKRPKRLSK